LSFTDSADIGVWTNESTGLWRSEDDGALDRAQC